MRSAVSPSIFHGQVPSQSAVCNTGCLLTPSIKFAQQPMPHTEASISRQCIWSLETQRVAVDTEARKSPWMSALRSLDSACCPFLVLAWMQYNRHTFRFEFLPLPEKERSPFRAAQTHTREPKNAALQCCTREHLVAQWHISEPSGSAEKPVSRQKVAARIRLPVSQLTLGYQGSSRLECRPPSGFETFESSIRVFASASSLCPPMSLDHVAL